MGGWMNGGMDRWMGGCMEGCMDGWMDGWVDKWRDGILFSYHCQNITVIILEFQRSVLSHRCLI
jgi:hypothetical protein